MAFPSRSLPGHLRSGSTTSIPQGASTGQSPALVARISEKKTELKNLKELRDLSAAVAGQMGALEQKLSTLSDGTEAIATVLGNWHNVLRAINMASAKIPGPQESPEADSSPTTGDIELPQTLVRIPTEHAPALQAQTESLENEQNTSDMSTL